MKTTIALAAILLAVSPFATAEDISLAWGDDFNSGTSTQYKDADPLPVGGTGKCYVVTGSNLKTQNFTDSAPNTSTGFTVAINALYRLDSYSDTLCSFWIKETTDETTQEDGGQGDVVVDNTGENALGHPYEIRFDKSTKTYSLVKESSKTEIFGAVGESDTSGLTKKEWYSLFLTLEEVAGQAGTQYTLTTMSMDGTVVGTESGTLTGDDDEPVTGSLTRLTLGDMGGSSDVNADVVTGGMLTHYTLRADNFGVYNGILSTEQMKEVTLYEVDNSTMPETVKAAPTPEPTTATLSLLALAALAARRRRH